MKRGTIVLTIFPFTDLSTSKRRPAVIISKSNETKEDAIVAFISTVIPEALSETDLLFDPDRNDFIQSGLKKSSVIKLDKLATLKKAIFTGELGTLGQQTLTAINKRLKIALSID